MHLSRYYLALLPVLARAPCPGDYVEAPFGKCYHLVSTGGGIGGYHFQCSALCGSDASLDAPPEMMAPEVEVVALEAQAPAAGTIIIQI